MFFLPPDVGEAFGAAVVGMDNICIACLITSVGYKTVSCKMAAAEPVSQSIRQRSVVGVVQLGFQHTFTASTAQSQQMA